MHPAILDATRIVSTPWHYQQHRNHRNQIVSIYSAIQNLKTSLPLSEQGAVNFLSGYDPKTQEQLINAIYLGREHIHSVQLREDVDISCNYVRHISPDEYPQIIAEKGENSVKYLDKLEECSEASGFDLNSL